MDDLAKDLTELKRFVVECMRIRRTLQVYKEFFETHETASILQNADEEVAFIIKRAMHDEIIISISRLYDGYGYKTKEACFEYLSQINLIGTLLKKYNIQSKEISPLRARTKQLLDEIDIKSYRDRVIAHNDKEILMGEDSVKHKAKFQKLIDLIETSTHLAIELQANLQNNDQVEFWQWQDPKDKFIGKGSRFLERIKSER